MPAALTDSHQATDAALAARLACGPLQPWLLGIARNFVRRRTGTHAVEAPEPDELALPPSAIDPATPDAALAARRDLERLRAAITAPIVVTSERWFSPEFNIVVYAKQSDPRSGDTIYRLTNFKRGEPPAELFKVQAEYKAKGESRR
jgi:hypothetical protein